MSREIKFRAWDKENKQIELVDFLGENTLHICNAEWENREDFEIMQYTGLKDKNDKEIYEDDIVQAVWYSYEGPEHETFGKVIFNNGWLSFCIWNELIEQAQEAIDKEDWDAYKEIQKKVREEYSKESDNN